MKSASAARKCRFTTTKVTTRAGALLLCSFALLCAAPVLAVEPAGGTPYPPGTAPQDEIASGAEVPDASVDERGWLAPSTVEDESPLATSAAPGSSLFTLLGLLLVTGLGGAAFWLQRRKRAASPAGQIESRLTLLSSTRVGPKAFAVSAEVNGRVLLLGVTDHTVTHLGWLDPPELEATATAEGGVSDVPEPGDAVPTADDELPDDYPGSALRAAAAAAQQSSLLPPASPLTSSHNLRRFQEVLRGAVPARPNPLRAPSTPPRAELPSRPSFPLGSDAASTLAALTSDIVPSSSSLAPPPVVTPTHSGASNAPSEPAPAGRSVAPASLRRKRQRRQEQLTSKAPKATKSNTPAEAPAAELEGQVAGLRALKNG